MTTFKTVMNACYILAKNDKAIEHFKTLGAELSFGTVYSPDSYGDPVWPQDVYFVSGLPCCKNGRVFHKYLKDNNLLLYP